MPKQVYDANGTIFYSCSLIAEDRQWMLQFEQGTISISGPSIGLYYHIHYPEEEHWTFEYIEPNWNDSSLIEGAIIKNSKFILEIATRKYYNPDPSGSDEPNISGHLELYAGAHNIAMTIPEKVARAIMKFVSGSTDLDDATYVIRK
jgi:hypothetical protein